MSKPSILYIDTVCDRKEIWHTLHRLKPSVRAAFLKWACGQVADDKGMRPVACVTRAEVEDAMRHDDGDLRLTNSVYGLLLTLGSQWGLDLVKAAVEAERLAKAAGRASR